MTHLFHIIIILLIQWSVVVLFIIIFNLSRASEITPLFRSRSHTPRTPHVVDMASSHPGSHEPSAWQVFEPKSSVDYVVVASSAFFGLTAGRGSGSYFPFSGVMARLYYTFNHL